MTGEVPVRRRFVGLREVKISDNDSQMQVVCRDGTHRSCAHEGGDGLLRCFTLYSGIAEKYCDTMISLFWRI